MPTRVVSYHGYFAATALCHRMRSGNPASARFFQHTSWNALDRFAVPMPSIWTTTNPRFVSPAYRLNGLNVLGVNDPCGPA